MHRRFTLAFLLFLLLATSGSTFAQTNLLGPETYPDNINPLTGLPVDDASLLERRPLLVKISNSPAIVRPQSGLNSADIVWEHLLSGGVTRFSAIFLGSDLEQVGPIRSGRLVDFELTRIYHALFVYSGMAQGTIDILNRDPYVLTRAVGGAGPCPALCRVPREGVALEHTLYGDTLALRQLAEERDRDTAYEPVYGMAFSEATPEGMVEVEGIDVYFNETVIGWTWDETSGLWVRSQDNEPHFDAITEAQVSADNVVIFEEEHTIQPEVTPGYWGPGDFAFSVNFVGSGRVYLFRDGQYVEGEWRRESQDDVLRYYDLQGNPLAFKPGRTFFTLVPRWVDGYYLAFHLTNAPTVTVSGDGGQNMRTGPGEAYRQLDVAYPGDTYTAIGRNRAGDWVQLYRNGDGLVWMALSSLYADPAAIMALPVARPTNER
ncbi:MAG: DUF3048 domain-containing protein [bacterium]|nr:DUF3048 domain-containing protein [bacterium]